MTLEHRDLSEWNHIQRSGRKSEAIKEQLSEIAQLEERIIYLAGMPESQSRDNQINYLMAEMKQLTRQNLESQKIWK